MRNRPFGVWAELGPEEPWAKLVHDVLLGTGLCSRACLAAALRHSLRFDPEFTMNPKPSILKPRSWVEESCGRSQASLSVRTSLYTQRHAECASLEPMHPQVNPGARQAADRPEHGRPASRWTVAAGCLLLPATSRPVATVGISPQCMQHPACVPGWGGILLPLPGGLLPHMPRSQACDCTRAVEAKSRVPGGQYAGYTTT